jgi:hypothetical protein
MMLYLAGAIYAFIFWFAAFRRPAVALALIFALAPFQNDLSGGGPVKFSIAEINLALTVPILLLRAPRFVIGPVLVPVLLYLGVCAASSALHWRPTTLVCLIQMALYLLVAVAVFASLPSEPEDVQLALLGLVGVGVFLSLTEIITRSNYVLGLHKNGVGASLSCALLVGMELWFAAEPGRRKRWLTAAVVFVGAGLLISLSRGAWLGTLCGAGTLVLMRRQFGLFFRAALVLLPVLLIVWNFLPKESRETATGFDSTRWNIKARYESIALARSYFEKDPLLGSGVGLRKEYDATNIVWLTLAETGVLGAATLLLIQISFLSMVWRAQKVVDRDDPLFSLLALGAALVISGLAHGLVDHYWSRGAIMISWASAGMATFAYWALKRRAAEGDDEEEDLEEVEEIETVS